MKSIQHDQARAWIQAAADGVLPASEQDVLKAHLDGCVECRTYAAEIQSMENGLKRTLQTHWGAPQLSPRAVDQLVRDVQNDIGKGGAVMAGKSSFLKWALGLGAVGALALCGIVGIGSYRLYSQMDTRLSTFSPVSVWFANPQQGSALPFGNPLVINAKAQGPEPILYMQLETDGEVVGIIGAPSSQGVMLFSADFNWQPEEQKTYKLTARAFDALGNESEATLVLDIVAADQLSEADLQTAYAPAGPHAPPGLGEGGGGGASPPQPGDEPPYQPPPPPQQETISLLEEYESSKPWSPTLAGWFDFVFSDPNKPAAPGIPATAVEGCTPRIWISNNSDNEDGFRVFRRDPGALNFIEIGTEAAYDGPVFTFEDEEEDLYGTYEYQVSAFNQSGESFSNISEPVMVDSPNCQPENKLQIKLDLQAVLGLGTYDEGYCYYSLDGVHWTRHPQSPDKFFGPGELGAVPEGLLEILYTKDEQMLDLECWGWGGGALQLIGEWHFDSVLQNELGIATLTEGIVTYGGSTGGGGPYDPSLPRPGALLLSGPQDCANFFNMPNPLIKGLICGDIADDLDFVAAIYLCLFGDCIDEADIVGFNFYDTLSGGGVPVNSTDYPANIYFPIDPSACAPRLIHVTMLVEVDGEVHESLPSNQVIYAPEEICGFLAGTEPRMYRITWDSVDFSVGDIDDDPDIEDDAEGFGWLSLETGTGHEIYWHMPMFDGFEDEGDENPYFFSGILLSQHDFPCLGVMCYLGGAIGSSTGNNSANFPLFIGEGFRLSVRLSEYDDDQEHDVLCLIDPYTHNWNWTAGQVGGPGWVSTTARTAHHNNSSCTVTVTIEGLP